MFKEFLIVGAGSFMGGGLRYITSRLCALYLHWLTFPTGTFIVNILGCLLIGLLSGLQCTQHALSDTTKLLLVTGFCGGFTTFSTFMNENTTLVKDGNITTMALYTALSVVVGFVCVILGNYISKQI
ncbi:MAG: fluoride efflux transporter CrcB [Muribaculaceae bacterium]|nr:fluoride efflux transporter CrcB [Muribaculaceae bacterium]